MEAAVRREVAEDRHRPADPLELLDLERHLRLVSDREHVEDRVGRAAERVDARDGVLERLLCKPCWHDPLL